MGLRLPHHSPPCCLHPVELSVLTESLLRDGSAALGLPYGGHHQELAPVLARALCACTARFQRGATEMQGLTRDNRACDWDKVMVTTNIATDLDITNGARGTIVDVFLNPEEFPLEDSAIISLKLLLQRVLVKLNRTRAARLNGLDDGVIPIFPAKCSMEITLEKTTKMVPRWQSPVTVAYCFTDYRSQGQTIPRVIVDIASPPTGKLSLFNLYVALLRSSWRETIRLFRESNDEIFL